MMKKRKQRTDFQRGIDARNKRIMKKYIASNSKSKMTDIAGEFGLSRQRVTKIVSEQEESIREAMERKGLSNDGLLQALIDALLANKVLGFIHHYKKDQDGKIAKCGPDEAVSDDFLEVPDHYVRLKAAEMGFKLKGELIDRRKVEVSHARGQLDGEILAYLKLQGRDWDGVKQFMAVLGTRLPDQMPDWWDKMLLPGQQDDTSPDSTDTGAEAPSAESSPPDTGTDTPNSTESLSGPKTGISEKATASAPEPQHESR